MNDTFSKNSQVGVVENFSELVTTAFAGKKNALCWQRNLAGDFAEIVEKLSLKENVTAVLPEDLLALQLSPNGVVARAEILADLQSLTDIGASPSLNLIHFYERDDEFDFIATDVYSFHVDRSPVQTDTILCTYFGAASDIVPNDQVIQKILIPDVRAQLASLHDGPADEFDAFLAEYFFDLHYLAKPDAQPTNLGVGNLWRLAVDFPEQTVLPCVYRAPVENAGEYRLLLIC